MIFPSTTSNAYLQESDTLPEAMEMKAGPNRPHEPWKAFQVRQRSLDAKRDVVLQTAAHLFLEHGYRRTSMSELGTRLKITKPALYYYFRNKEEILIECYRAGIEAIEGLLDEAAVSQGNGLNKVKAYIEAYAKAIVTHDFGRCVATLDDSELSPKARREVRTLKRRIDLAIRGYVEEGIADGSVTQCNAKMASFALAGAINWIGTWYRPEGALSPDEIATAFASLLTGGLRQGAAKAPGLAVKPSRAQVRRKRQKSLN
jgi:AcrR family transcriptional regulator